MESEASLGIDNFRRISGTKCYRACKPSSSSSTKVLKNHNIRTIIDLRSKQENRKDVFQAYHPFTLKVPFTGAGEKPQLISTSDPEVKPEELLERDRRYRVMVHMDGIKSMTQSAPWYTRFLFVLCHLLDRLFDTHLANWAIVRIFLRSHGENGLTFTLKKLLTSHMTEIASILHFLSLPEYVPAVFICSLGKDRTGIMSALVGHICGMSREEIIEDYTKSEQELSMAQAKQFAAMDAMGLHPVFKKAPPECIISLLDYVDEKFGSMDNFLESIGVGQEDQEKLRRNIVMSNDEKKASV